jgi:CheY-like chemotaxis protein
VAIADRGLEGVRVLAVEDQDDSRDLLQFVLQREGAIVDTARNAPEAKAALAAKRFDVLVADLGLPGEDGYSLIRAVRQTFPSPAREILAVALTAYAGDYYRTKALSAGYDAYVAKPIEPSRLMEVLRGLVRQ